CSIAPGGTTTSRRRRPVALRALSVHPREEPLPSGRKSGLSRSRPPFVSSPHRLFSRFCFLPRAFADESTCRPELSRKAQRGRSPASPRRLLCRERGRRDQMSWRTGIGPNSHLGLDRATEKRDGPAPEGC